MRADGRRPPGPAGARIALEPDGLVVGEAITVPVAVAGGGYDIHVGGGLLARLGEMYPPRPGARGALVTNETVGALYGEAALEALRSAGWAVERLAVPDGEQSKSLAMAERLYGGCLASRLDRGATVFALGGGVVSDLAGFVAGTYMRGLAFVPVPTTLLAMVDASVGGKTAVDLPQAKNLVGVFHQPRLVVMDVDTLASLPEREFRGGMAEVIKHAVIADAELFAYLERVEPGELRRDRYRLTRMVARNCQIKAGVVVADPTERGLRACLNYGHTIGHALEVAAGDWDLRHGETVALGMAVESRLAVRLGVATPEVAQRLEAVLTRHGLLTRTASWDRDAARAALRHDKKVVDGRLRLPLVPAIGQVVISEDVPLDALVAALDEIPLTGA